MHQQDDMVAALKQAGNHAVKCGIIVGYDTAARYSITVSVLLRLAQ